MNLPRVDMSWSAICDFVISSSYSLAYYARIQRGSGTGDPNHKNIGFLINAGPDPLKTTKLPSQHSMLGLHRWNSVSLAGRWWSAIVVFGSPHLSKLDPLWQSFLDPRMLLYLWVWASQHNHRYWLGRQKRCMPDCLVPLLFKLYWKAISICQYN